MAFNLTSPVTGAAVSGLTSPTFTISSDTPPSATGRQFAVTALGGTQVGSTAHSISSPFTITAWRPPTFKVLGQPTASGLLKSFPRNTFDVLTRKGVTVLSGQPTQICTIRSTFAVPAGADVVDIANLRSAWSLHVGAVLQQLNGLMDLYLTGTL